MNVLDIQRIQNFHHTLYINMESFLEKFNEKLNNASNLHTPKFVGDPFDLPISHRQELEYRYQYLDDSVECLASLYRVTPKALGDYLHRRELKRVVVDTPEKAAEFETYVNAQYKNSRMLLSGLVTLHSAKAWQDLAASEDNILASLCRASDYLSLQAEPDAKLLSQLTTIHNRLIDRHAIIKQAIDIPADKDQKGFIDSITKTLKDILDDIEGEGYKLPNEIAE